MQLIKNSLKQQQISPGINEEYRLAVRRDYEVTFFFYFEATQQ
jgi:hypothetical protein